MSGERAFDDDRWPDEEGFACCFMCGRKIDPLDPARGTYGTYVGGVAFHEPLPLHVPCADGVEPTRIEVAYRTAMNQMGENAAKRMRAAARCAL